MRVCVCAVLAVAPSVWAVPSTGVTGDASMYLGNTVSGTVHETLPATLELACIYFQPLQAVPAEATWNGSTYTGLKLEVFGAALTGSEAYAAWPALRGDFVYGGFYDSLTLVTPVGGEAWGTDPVTGNQPYALGSAGRTLIWLDWRRTQSEAVSHTVPARMSLADWSNAQLTYNYGPGFGWKQLAPSLVSFGGSKGFNYTWNGPGYWPTEKNWPTVSSYAWSEWHSATEIWCYAIPGAVCGKDASGQRAIIAPGSSFDASSAVVVAKFELREYTGTAGGGTGGGGISEECCQEIVAALADVQDAVNQVRTQVQAANVHLQNLEDNTAYAGKGVAQQVSEFYEYFRYWVEKWDEQRVEINTYLASIETALTVASEPSTPAIGGLGTPSTFTARGTDEPEEAIGDVTSRFGAVAEFFPVGEDATTAPVWTFTVPFGIGGTANDKEFTVDFAMLGPFMPWVRGVELFGVSLLCVMLVWRELERK